MGTTRRGGRAGTRVLELEMELELELELELDFDFELDADLAVAFGFAFCGIKIIRGSQNDPHHKA